MGKLLGVIGTAAAGAGLMYYLDPDRGGRRRTQLWHVLGGGEDGLWSSRTRMIVGASGGALLAIGATQHKAARKVLMGVGSAMVSRSVSNRGVADLVHLVGRTA